MKGRDIIMDIRNAIRKRFHEDEEQTFEIKKAPIAVPTIVPPIADQKKSDVKQSDDKLTFVNVLESTWISFSEWFKKSSTIIITMLLVGFACGMFVSKIVYDFRMNEIAQMAKSGSSGYVYKGQIYDVKLRP